MRKSSLGRSISSGEQTRSKRPRSSTSSSNNNNNNNHNRHQSEQTTSDTTIIRNAKDKNNNKDVVESSDDVDENKGYKNNTQRLYRGVCPDVSNRYRKVGGGRIGQGTYGVVYCARDTWKEAAGRNRRNNDGNHRENNTKTTKTNEIVALKKCYAHHEASDGFPITTLREIQALKICSSHPNIVDLLEISVSGGSSTTSSSSAHATNDDKDSKHEKNKASKANANANANDGFATTTSKSTIKVGKSNVFLVFEHCRYDLAQILDSYQDHRTMSRFRRSALPKSPFSLRETKTLAKHLLSALEFCHDHRLIHRDIKPSNLLYDTTTGNLKVCDFGLSRTAAASDDNDDDDVHMTPNVVSLWYRAPELLLPSSGKHTTGSTINYSFPIDLWATGCVIAELLQGRPFLDGTSEIDQLKKMNDALGPPSSHIYDDSTYHSSLLSSSKDQHRNNNTNKTRNRHTSMGLWDRFEHLPPQGLFLLARLLEYDPKERWTATEALQARFLSPKSDPPPIQNLQNMPKSFPGC